MMCSKLHLFSHFFFRGDVLSTAHERGAWVGMGHYYHQMLFTFAIDGAVMNVLTGNASSP